MRCASASMDRNGFCSLKKISSTLVYFLIMVVSFAFEIRFVCSLYFRTQVDMYYEIKVFSLPTKA